MQVSLHFPKGRDSVDRAEGPAQKNICGCFQRQNKHGRDLQAPMVCEGPAACSSGDAQEKNKEHAESGQAKSGHCRV